MKTSEFIKKIEELGFDFEVNDNWVSVYDKIYGCIAKVYEYSVNALDTYWNGVVASDLFNLCVDYARTPIEERKEPKKYYLYNPIKKEYFNYHKINKYYVWSSLYQTENIQSQFTEEEIKNHKFRDIMELLEKEEVE